MEFLSQLALPAGAMVGMLLLRVRGVATWRALPLVWGGAASAVVAAHAGFLFLNPDAWSTPGIVWKVWLGLSAPAGVIGFLIYYLSVARFAPPPLSAAGDFLVPSVWLGLAAARGVCFTQGCCEGVRIAYVVLCLILAALSWRMAPRRLYDGEVMALSVGAYGLFASFIEYLREPLVPGTIRVSGLALLAGLAAAILFEPRGYRAGVR